MLPATLRRHTGPLLLLALINWPGIVLPAGLADVPRRVQFGVKLYF